jgi:hypothetical protein
MQQHCNMVAVKKGSGLLAWLRTLMMSGQQALQDLLGELESGL